MYEAKMNRLRERMRQILTSDLVQAVDSEPDEGKATYAQLERNFAGDWRIPLSTAHIISLVVQSERRQGK